MYAETQREKNQIDTLHAIAALDEPVVFDQNLVDPFDENEDLSLRARSYLHTNCAQCHRPDGPTNVDIDFRFTATFEGMNLCNAELRNGDLGVRDAKRMVPGDIEKSIFLNRMNRRDSLSMPPLGSAIPDTAGHQLLSDWVLSLASCN